MSDPGSPPKPRPASGVVVPKRLRWHGQLAAAAIFTTATAFSATWRARFHDECGLFAEPNTGPMIFSIWHNRLALCMVAYHKYVFKRRPSAGLAALISASKDGALLARTLRYFGVTPVRGSSSRRGRQALLELTTHLQNGFHAAITPDGPKGPKYNVQEGIIGLSQVTGVPIIPVSAVVSHKWSLRSWDAFQIPWPFARCDIYFGKPLRVPRNADAPTREALRTELQRLMLSITID